MKFKKLIASLVAATCSTALLAQGTLGTVANVQGVVTATTGTTVTTVTPGMTIVNGMRFVTTSGSAVTLRLNSGCVVNVNPGNGVTVLQSMTCEQLTASVRPVTVTAAGPGFPPAPLIFNGLIAIGGIFIAAELLREVTRDENLSPS